MAKNNTAKKQPHHPEGKSCDCPTKCPQCCHEKGHGNPKEDSEKNKAEVKLYKNKIVELLTPENLPLLKKAAILVEQMLRNKNPPKKR